MIRTRCGRAPRTTPVGRLDEAAAARQPDLRCAFPAADRTAAEANG